MNKINYRILLFIFLLHSAKFALPMNIENESEIDSQNKNSFSKEELISMNVQLPAALFRIGLPLNDIIKYLIKLRKFKFIKNFSFEKGDILVRDGYIFTVVIKDPGDNNIVVVTPSRIGETSKKYGYELEEIPKEKLFKLEGINLKYKNLNQYFTLPALVALMSIISISHLPSNIFDEKRNRVGYLLDLPNELYTGWGRKILETDIEKFPFLGNFPELNQNKFNVYSYFNFDENNKFTRGEIVLDGQLKNVGIISAINIDNNPKIYRVQFYNPYNSTFDFRNMRSKNIGKLLPESEIKEAAKHLQEQEIIPKDVEIVLANGSNFFVWRFKDIIQHNDEDEAIKKLKELKKGFNQLKLQLLTQKDKDISKLANFDVIENLLGTAEHIKLEGAGLTQKDIDDLIKDKNNQKENEMENLKNLNIFNIADQLGYTPIKFAQYLNKPKVVGYLLSEEKK